MSVDLGGVVGNRGEHDQNISQKFSINKTVISKTNKKILFTSSQGSKVLSQPLVMLKGLQEINSLSKNMMA